MTVINTSLEPNAHHRGVIVKTMRIITTAVNAKSSLHYAIQITSFICPFHRCRHASFCQRQSNGTYCVWNSMPQCITWMTERRTASGANTVGYQSKKLWHWILAIRRSQLPTYAQQNHNLERAYRNCELLAQRAAIGPCAMRPKRPCERRLEHCADPET